MEFFQGQTRTNVNSQMFNEIIVVISATGLLLSLLLVLLVVKSKRPDLIMAR